MLEAAPLNRTRFAVFRNEFKSDAAPVRVRLPVPEPLTVTPSVTPLPDELDSVALDAPPEIASTTVRLPLPVTAFSNRISPFDERAVKLAGRLKVGAASVAALEPVGPTALAVSGHAVQEGA